MPEGALESLIHFAGEQDHHQYAGLRPLYFEWSMKRFASE
jgi:hypothetical protein